MCIHHKPRTDYNIMSEMYLEKEFARTRQSSFIISGTLPNRFTQKR